MRSPHVEVIGDVSQLPFKAQSLDELRAFSVLDRFAFEQLEDILFEWRRVLKAEGVLELTVLNAKQVAESLTASKRRANEYKWLRTIYNPDGSILSGQTKSLLEYYLTRSGFRVLAISELRGARLLYAVARKR